MAKVVAEGLGAGGPSRSRSIQEAEADEAAYQQFVQTHLRRNFTVNLIHGMLGLTGFRLFYAPTFIPAYIHRLTGSDALVGLGTSLLQLGVTTSPLVSASRIEHEPTILPYAVRTGSMMRIMILAMAIAGWFLSGPLLLGATLICLTLLGVFTGTQRVAFQMLMSKVIPIARRGRLQAWRNAAGGLIAAGLSYLAGRFLIGPNVFGNGFATTFFVAFLLTSLGLTVLQIWMKEPRTPNPRAPKPLLERLRDFPRLLADPAYFWFIMAEALTVCARLASPFYVLYAARTLGLSGATIGTLSLAYLGCDTASNLIWGHLGDRTGYRLVFMVSTAVWAGGTLLLIAIHQPWSILVSFCCFGAGNAGYLMSQQTMVLEFGDRHDVAMRLALSTTIEGVLSTVGPLVGGLVATAFGYNIVMICAAIFLVSAFIVLTFKVKDPRHHRPVRALTTKAGAV